MVINSCVRTTPQTDRGKLAPQACEFKTKPKFSLKLEFGKLVSRLRDNLFLTAAVARLKYELPCIAYATD